MPRWAILWTGLGYKSFASTKWWGTPWTVSKKPGMPSAKQSCHRCGRSRDWFTELPPDLRHFSADGDTAATELPYPRKTKCLFRTWLCAVAPRRGCYRTLPLTKKGDL